MTSVTDSHPFCYLQVHSIIFGFHQSLDVKSIDPINFPLMHKSLSADEAVTHTAHLFVYLFIICYSSVIYYPSERSVC